MELNEPENVGMAQQTLNDEDECKNENTSKVIWPSQMLRQIIEAQEKGMEGMQSLAAGEDPPKRELLMSELLLCQADECKAIEERGGEVQAVNGSPATGETRFVFTRKF